MGHELGLATIRISFIAGAVQGGIGAESCRRGPADNSCNGNSTAADRHRRHCRGHKRESAASAWLDRASVARALKKDRHVFYCGFNPLFLGAFYQRHKPRRQFGPSASFR